MRVQVVLPILYVIVSGFLLLGPPGAAGHGHGGEVFFYMSLPIGTVSLLVEKLFSSGELAVLSCFVAGMAQYALIGYLIDRITRRKQQNK